MGLDGVASTRYPLRRSWSAQRRASVASGYSDPSLPPTPRVAWSAARPHVPHETMESVTETRRALQSSPHQAGDVTCKDRSSLCRRSCLAHCVGYRRMGRGLGRRRWSAVTVAYLVGGMRTPIGRYAGALSAVRTDDLAADPIPSLP